MIGLNPAAIRRMPPWNNTLPKDVCAPDTPSGDQAHIAVRQVQ
jgi:hypothetical protein